MEKRAVKAKMQEILHFGVGRTVLFKKKRKTFLEKSSHRGKRCGKLEKLLKYQCFASPQQNARFCPGFPQKKRSDFFPQQSFSFPRSLWKKRAEKNTVTNHGAKGKYTLFSARKAPPAGIGPGPGKRQRLELILVLISLTRSAKEGSFFICFSTCLME